MLLTVVLVSIIGCSLAAPSVVRSKEEIEAFKVFLENSRIDDGTSFEARMLANPLAKEWENSGKYQGDIVLTKEQEQQLLRQYSEGRNAYILSGTKWPNSTIIYEFAAGLTQEQEKAILDAIQDIEKNTCIKFRVRQPTDRNYVRVTGNPGGCYASVGFTAAQTVHLYNLAANTPGVGCFRHATIIHEWMHIIGFLHMQSTHNRDDYVRILWENIVPGLEFNFSKYSPLVVDNLGLPYEYDSTMHYGRYGFSINGRATMEPIYDDQGLMGQQRYITDYDWLRVRRHYQCPGAWDELPDSSEE